MKIKAVDHLVLTTTGIEQMIDFYSRVLGMEPVTFADGRKALRFGNQKINLHKAGDEIIPHAQKPLPGSADICLITETPMQQVLSHLASCRVKIVEGPVMRTGACGPLLSLYIHDPDGNLVEIANQKNE